MVKNPVPLPIGGFVGGGLQASPLLREEISDGMKIEAVSIYFLAQPHFTQPHRGLYSTLNYFTASFVTLLPTFTM